MKRRDFIRLGGFLTVSAATMGMTGCDIEGEDDDQSLFPPATPEPVRAMPAAATGANWKFPQSIASADPRPDSIILWTRVVDNLLPPTAPSTVSTSIRLVVAAEDDNVVANLSASIGTNADISASVLVADAMVPAHADFDSSVRHKLTGLNDASVYYYQFIAGDVRSNVGRFKTAPAAANSDEVKFIFMSCQDWSANHWDAFTQIVADDATPANPDVDFIVHLGDYIYETDDNGTAPDEASKSVITLPFGAALQPSKTEKSATELADYRYLYKLYRSDTRIQKMHERFPMVAVWDDHEFSDDGWQTAETYTNTNSPMFQRRRNANQAWFEFMPADVSFSEVDPGFQNIKLYRDLKFGATVHLVMTDERLYRQDHLIPESTINPATGLPLGRINSRYLVPEATLKSAELQKDAPGLPLGPLGLITILGQTQRDWWKSTMSSSTSTWKVWGNEVSLLRMGLNGTKAVGTLIALQTISGMPATMTAALGNAQIQALPKVEAGASAAVSLGATPTIAIPASFAILQTFAATGNAGAAIAAGEAAGLTNAQATAALTAIGAKTPTAAEIGNCATTVAAATAVYMTTNMSQAAASTTAAGITVAMLLTDTFAGGAATDPQLLAAAKGSSSLSDAAGMIIVNVYKAAKAAGGSGQAAQVGAGATAFAAGGVSLVLIRTNVETNKLTSSFVIASGLSATVAPFFQKLLLNADQWDGYRKERTHLMNHLVDKGIQNVVAVTGDIHAFFAGRVFNEFAGEVLTIDTSTGSAVETSASAGGVPAMVDLVTAGNSSTSWFSYLKEQAALLNPLLVTLVSRTIPAGPADPATGAIGLPFPITLPVLDFSMGKSLTPAALFAVARDSLKQGAAAAGVPESALAGFGGINGIATSIANSSSFQLLCSALAYIGADNSWLNHVDTNAQGYAVVTASSTTLTCEFKKLNSLFITGGNGFAPGTVPGGADARGTVTSSTTVTLNPALPLTDANALVVGATTFS